jgi:Uma2 family endonuclease
MSVQLARRLFTITEYHQMTEVGILSEDDRVELINGEIVAMAPIGSRHAAGVDRINALFNSRIGQQAIVRIQSPIQLDEYSEPQPDLSLLQPRADFYAQAHPTPADVLLVIEVAETSIDYDRTVKLPLYARASISEAWLIDIANDRIEIHKQPSQGIYQEVRYALRGQNLSPQSFPNLNLSVEELLG